MSGPDTYWDLFAGYTAIWFLVVLFLVRLVKRQERLEHMLQQASDSANQQEPVRREAGA